LRIINFIVDGIRISQGELRNKGERLLIIGTTFAPMLPPPIPLVNTFSAISLYTFSSHRSWASQGTETLFAGPTNRALPIIRQVLKPDTWGYLSLTIPFVRIVYIPAIDCLTLPHLLWFGHDPFSLIKKTVLFGRLLFF